MVSENGAPSEGVVKFDLHFTAREAQPEENVRELSAWRDILRRLGVLGQTPGRYGGFGFGNISRRMPPFDVPPGREIFLITGTQTGGIDVLGPEGYALVRECHPEGNRVVAEGPIRPSAEALTHGTLYALRSSVHWVMHAHSPEIWGSAERLGIPRTSPHALYGSPELAAEILTLLSDSRAFDLHILAVAGHEDGIFAFGSSAEEAGGGLLRYLARSLALG